MGLTPDTDGAAFQAVARPSRRGPAVVALAALAVVAAALVTRSPAPAVSAPTAEVTARPTSAAATPSREPTAVASRPTAPSGPPARNPIVTPHPASVGVAAPAGETQLIPAGTDSVRLTITVPDGWSRTGQARLVKSNDGGQPAASIAAWRLEHVYTFPCRWSTRAFADASLIGTAEGQAVALSSWWGQDPTMPPKSNAAIAPIASRPQATTLQGVPAWSLEVLIPSGFDLTACDGGQLVLWDTSDGDVRSSLGPGELSRLWVVDVDGERIVIDAASIGASPADLAELQAVVDSVVFEP